MSQHPPESPSFRVGRILKSVLEKVSEWVDKTLELW
jgi:hypothetical protein